MVYLFNEDGRLYLYSNTARAGDRLDLHTLTDSFFPMGPWIVTRDELGAAPDLAIRSFVNGEPRQNSRTSCLIHSVAEIIEDLSRGITLRAGTIIATGTPSGVGMGFDPPRYLRSGDRVRCEIEGIGALENSVR